MQNPIMKEQLKKALGTGKLAVKYPDGYKKWKKKFDYWFKVTNSVSQTLDIMYGPGGGVNNYKGSLYRNSTLDLNKKLDKKKPKANKGKFAFVKIKKGAKQ